MWTLLAWACSPPPPQPPLDSDVADSADSDVLETGWGGDSDTDVVVDTDTDAVDTDTDGVEDTDVHWTDPACEVDPTVPTWIWNDEIDVFVALVGEDCITTHSKFQLDLRYWEHRIWMSPIEQVCTYRPADDVPFGWLEGDGGEIFYLAGQVPGDVRDPYLLTDAGEFRWAMGDLPWCGD